MTTDWKRLEGTSVDPSLEEGLQARIADPMWMLARQWQTGEFTGEDAASPVLITATVGWSPVSQFKPNGGTWGTLPTDGPLEALVEREDPADGAASLRRSADAGLAFLRMLDAHGQAQHRAIFRSHFDLAPLLPADDGLAPSARRMLELLGRRSLDGFGLAVALQTEPTDWTALPGSLTPSERAAVEPALQEFRGWLADHVRQPNQGAPSSWDPQRMEYSFAVSGEAPGGWSTLKAREYPGGHLDWYAFDLAPSEGDPPLTPSGSFAATRTQTVLPVPLRYPGMPANRWWEFEDQAVYWGDIEGGPEDLARYLVASFAAIFGDDYYLVPFRLDAGSLCGVINVTVQDSFGNTHAVQSCAARDHQAGALRPWRFFELTGDTRPSSGESPLLYLAPSVPDRREGPELELVDLVRDEGANLGWGVERYVEHPTGARLDRQKAWESRWVGVQPTPPATPPVLSPDSGASDLTWRYRAMTTVPDYWVPLVPVQVDEPGGYQIGLLRGKLPRIVTAEGTITATSAQSAILEAGSVPPLLIREDEVPRGGVTVDRRFQLARGPDGRLALWIGRAKRPAGGPQESGLEFDTIERSIT